MCATLSLLCAALRLSSDIQALLRRSLLRRNVYPLHGRSSDLLRDCQMVILHPFSERQGKLVVARAGMVGKVNADSNPFGRGLE